MVSGSRDQPRGERVSDALAAQDAERLRPLPLGTLPSMEGSEAPGRDGSPAHVRRAKISLRVSRSRQGGRCALVRQHLLIDPQCQVGRIGL